MRVVFMGTPQFAVPSLRMLISSLWDVVAVFTKPDRPRGRGQRMHPSPVKEAAIEAGIRVETPRRLRDQETVAALRDLAPDVIVVAAYAQKVPPDVLEMPPLGCVNVHPSLLPKYRGGAPMRWTLFNGETETGVTTIVMGEGWDDGEMIVREKTPVGENETYGELSERLAGMGAVVLEKTLRLMENGEHLRTPQDESGVTWAPNLKPEDEILDWSAEVETVHNRVRGLSPKPGAGTGWRGKRIKILRTAVSGVSLSGEPGEVVSAEKGKGLFVATGCGVLEILEIQPAGKRPMQGKDFLNGYQPRPGEQFGETQ
jgi:methionyl-tRNA formyltransferase